MEMPGGKELRMSTTGMRGLKLGTMAGERISRWMPWNTGRAHPHPAAVWQPDGSMTQADERQQQASLEASEEPQPQGHKEAKCSRKYRSQGEAGDPNWKCVRTFGHILFWLKVRTRGSQPSICVPTFSQFTDRKSTRLNSS